MPAVSAPRPTSRARSLGRALLLGFGTTLVLMGLVAMVAFLTGANLAVLGATVSTATNGARRTELNLNLWLFLLVGVVLSALVWLTDARSRRSRTTD